MGFLDDLEQGLGRFNDRVREVKEFGKDPNYITPQDDADWMRQAANRTPPKTRAQIIASISASSPARYGRMRRDMKWLRKQAVNHGLAPDDARWLI